MGAVTNAVARRDEANAVAVSPKAVVKDLLERNKGALAMSLPRGFDADRFNRLLLTAANTNPKLFDCDPMSFIAAGVMAAQLGLEPNDARGLAYLLPFNDRSRGKVVQFILGYRGMMELARRSGLVSSINAFPVYRGDDFSFAFGLEPTLHHVPGDHDENPKDLLYVYAVAKVNGDPQFVVLTRRQIDAVKSSSQGGASAYSPWNTHYVEMAKKTAIRRLCKYLPQTVEMAQAMANEERTLTIGDLGIITPTEPEPLGHDDAVDVEALEAGSAAE